MLNQKTGAHGCTVDYLTGPEHIDCVSLILFAFLYCLWGSRGKDTGVVCCAAVKVSGIELANEQQF